MEEKFNHIDGHDCLDDALYTIFNERNLNYYYIFLESWRFCYKNDEKLIGNRIKPSRGDRFEILKNLYNVKSRVVDFKNQYDIYPLLSEAFSEYKIQNNKEKAYEELISNLQENKAIVLEFDSFYCPWDKLYNRIHGTHMCVIKSIKEENIEIFDRWYSEKRIITKEFLYEFMYKFIILDFSQYREQQLNIKQILSILIPEKNIFQRNLINFIKDMENMESDKEFENCTASNYTNHYLFRNIREISYNRKQIAILFKEAIKNEKNINKKYIEEFDELSKEWDILKNLIAMFYFTKSESDLEECIIKLKMIYKKEIGLIKELMEVKEKYE